MLLAGERRNWEPQEDVVSGLNKIVSYAKLLLELDDDA
jgi:hypothetical protein